MDELRENLKKLLLAGVGAVATVAEKSAEIIDDLAQKGGEAVDGLARKGADAGEEIKADLGKKYDEIMAKAPKTAEELAKWVETLSADAKQALTDILAGCQDDGADEPAAAEDAPAPCEEPEEAPAEPEQPAGDKTEE